MRIRAYQASDRGAVIGLFRGFMAELAPPALQAQFDAYVETAVREELGRIEAYYLARPRQGFWVAEDGGVIGMAGVERMDDERAELRRMAVAPARRRLGVGRALLETAEAFSRGQGYRVMALSTSELQDAARLLYEASGYRRVREETGAAPSHKTVGAGLRRYHYEKPLC